MIINQKPEQQARDNIDRQLKASGWAIQNKGEINLNASSGVAVREYYTDTGPADYILFVDRKPVGVIEAKREEEGHNLTVHEEQAEGYALSKLKYLNNDPLPFIYESTGEVTVFTDSRDPKPRSREVFTFHRPGTFRDMLKAQKPLRQRLLDLPDLPVDGLRDCQINAIRNLEKSFKANKPRALIQMATGSGKTFTAITFIYRLLKYAKADRILFLVDTKNLGEQAEQEFLDFLPNDDTRKFQELYVVNRLKSGYIPKDAHVYISTIQRIYSVLKGTELEETEEEVNPNERQWQAKAVPPVEYSERLPIEFFDFIVIDECHRSIYNLWKQVLEYFDAFQVGLTATPDNRTFGYFKQNIVSEYSHEQAVLDNVNVGYNVYTIDTKVSKSGGTIWQGEYIEKRERLTRKKWREENDEDIAYSAKVLDGDIVNPSQIRTIIKTFKEHLPEMFPDRIDKDGQFEVPKTLIFAKTDSHADDIIRTVREEFGEGNSFCKKITYKVEEDPKSVLSQFRNDYYPRIAVTVDMIATGTDVKPLECLLFMRDVKSRNYFEQMKGRGTRVLSLDDLRKVTPSARFTKDHFVIVDAIGVTKSLKTDSRPLEKKPTVPLKDLLGAIAVGARDEELFTSLANRLTRLDKQIKPKEKEQFMAKAGGKTISQVAKELIKAYDPDTLEEIREKIRRKHQGESPERLDSLFNEEHTKLIEQAAGTFNGELNKYIEEVRKSYEQIIDVTTLDEVLGAGWDKDNKEKAIGLITDFRQWIESHNDEITALQIFYSQKYQKREFTYTMITECLEILKADKPYIAPLRVWQAYEQLERVNGSPKSELTALVALIRKATGMDKNLTSYDKTVDSNFQQWVFRKQHGQLKFNEMQMKWLRMIKDHIAISFHLDSEDLDYSPFNDEGGRGKLWEIFGENTDEIIHELNEALVA